MLSDGGQIFFLIQYLNKKHFIAWKLLLFISIFLWAGETFLKAWQWPRFYNLERPSSQLQRCFPIPSCIHGNVTLCTEDINVVYQTPVYRKNLTMQNDSMSCRIKVKLIRTQVARNNSGPSESSCSIHLCRSRQWQTESM